MLFSRLKWGKYGAEILVKNIFISTKITIMKQIVFKRLCQIVELKKKSSFEINKKMSFLFKMRQSNFLFRNRDSKCFIEQ